MKKLKNDYEEKMSFVKENHHIYCFYRGLGKNKMLAKTTVKGLNCYRFDLKAKTVELISYNAL